MKYLREHIRLILMTEIREMTTPPEIAELSDLLLVTSDRSPKMKLSHEKSLDAARHCAPRSDLVTPIESLYQNIGMILPYIEDLKARHMRMVNKHRRHENIDTPEVQKALDTMKILIQTLEEFVLDMRLQIQEMSG